MIKKIISIGAVVLVVGFIAIQLVPVDHTNPPVVSEPHWDSPKTRVYAERACFDCHSNETKWPWYSYVAPLSWTVADHVYEGREHFNVSEWPSGEGEEAAETLLEGTMPLWEYTLLHPEAELTQAEMKEFAAGLKATFGEGEDEQEGVVSSGVAQDKGEQEEQHKEDDD